MFAMITFSVHDCTLDLRFYIVDSIRRFDLKSDGLTREGFDEDLHDGLL